MEFYYRSKNIMSSSLKLYLYNSISKTKEQFIPIDQQSVTMYVCGPTVYDRPHIGNIRSAVVYDVLFRLLTHMYPAVTYVRNITDIDDKIIKASQEREIPFHVLSEQMTKYYEEDTSSVLCLQPTISPRATQNLDSMFNMITYLIDREHAYVADDHVLFDISTYSEYGSLSRRTVDEMIAGSRVEVASFKKNPADFVLWKPSPAGEEEYSFDSPWGRGRPGWHIECSAMSTKFLGKDFDIHGGGVDLVFPHHENEVAQSVCANENSNFAKYWVHNGFLTVNGEKMSKSLGNFTLLKDLLEQGIPGKVIRYFYLMSHYRKPIDFNENAINSAKKSLAKLADIIAPLSKNYNNLADFETALEQDLKDGQTDVSEYLQILCNDLNTPELLAKLLQCSSPMQVAVICYLLGFKPSILLEKEDALPIPDEIIAIADRREEAKKSKDWQLADSLRNEIQNKGYSIMDQKGGGFDVKPVN